MGRQEFIEQIETLNCAVELLADDRIAFHYVPRLGRFMGQKIMLGFVVNDDFPANAPGGPQIKPRLLPLKGGTVHPDEGIHESPFGDEWEYWSRPFPNWNGSKKTAAEYMEHIDRLFDQ